MEMEQRACSLGINGPLSGIVKAVSFPEPHRLGPGDDPFHNHAAAKVELAAT